MKISLIEPRSPDYHVYSHVTIPRLGLPILATILSRLGHQVKVYVEDLQPIRLAEVIDIVKSDLVGISCTSSTAPRGYAMARLLRLKGIPVVLGGVHPTFLPEEALKYADYVIKGEAEQALPQLVQTLETGGNINRVPNLLYVHDGQIMSNPAKPLTIDLDDIPIPDYSLIHGHRKLKIIPVMTSRGCPHNCTFCCVSAMFGRSCRMKSVERALAELQQIGKARVFFCDDNFTMSLSRIKELLEQMLRHNIVPARWYAQVRADIHRDKELLDLMRRTHCRRVFVGLESVSQDVLDSYGKHQSVEDVENCVSAFHDHGISVHGMFMFGADQDDASTFARTVHFALEHDLDTVQFLILTPVPGSELFKKLDSEGRIFTYDWSIYDGHHVVFEPARMTPLELQIGTLRASRHFYSLRSVMRSISCLRLGTAMLRYLGRHVIQGWYETNTRFMHALRNWQRRRCGFPRDFSLQGQQVGLSPFLDSR